jgi:hypothetical protein
MSAIDAAAREAARAVNAAVSSEYNRRIFTISKFGRHPDGWLHARVVVNGTPFYFHRRYGSWLAPGTIGLREVLKEPEALLGSNLGRDVKFALSDKSAPFDAADRKAREEAENARKQAVRPTAIPADPGEDGGDAGVRVGGHSGDAPVAPEPVGA